MDNAFQTETKSELPPGWEVGMRPAAVPEDRHIAVQSLEALDGRPAHATQGDQPAASRPTDSAALRIVLRLLDIVVAGTLLVLFLPAMVLIGILIRLDSPGPALFVQMRMGRDRRALSDRRKRRPKEGEAVERRKRDVAGRPFRFVKFRTMHVDARERFPELYAYSYSDDEIRTMKFKLDNDPRLTRVGRWLRKTSLDELPNLWNVLTGDITLVGPRPEIPEMSPYYTPAQRRKFHVEPGVTGLAQIRGRGDLSFQETVDCDLEYVEKRTLGLNIRILWRTLIAVIRRRGAF